MKQIGKRIYDEYGFKRQVRHEVIPHHKYRTLVTCLGPCPAISIREAMNKGYYLIISYELCAITLTEQKKVVAEEFANNPNVKIIIRSGDVINAPLMEDCYYDLDFCGYITNFTKHVNKFRDNATFTFSQRPGNKKGLGKDHTINTFFETIGEKFKLEEAGPKRLYANTTEGKYLLLSYMGGENGKGSPMITITKIEKYKNEIV